MATTTLEIGGVTASLALGPVVPTDDGGYRNGRVTLPDGRTFRVGGGWVHSAESATAANRSRGLQTDTHPEMHWPGATGAGEFEAYSGSDMGDIDGLAAATGADSDDVAEAVRDASARAAR